MPKLVGLERLQPLWFDGGNRKKKTKRLERIEIIDRERYEGFDVDTKIELIRALIPLGMMNVVALLDEEVMRLAGPRSAPPGVTNARHPLPKAIHRTTDKLETPVRNALSASEQLFWTYRGLKATRSLNCNAAN